MSETLEIMELAKENLRIVDVFKDLSGEQQLFGDNTTRSKFKRLSVDGKNSVIRLVGDEEYDNAYRNSINNAPNIGVEEKDKIANEHLATIAKYSFTIPSPATGEPGIIMYKASEVAKFHNNKFGDPQYNISLLQLNYLQNASNWLRHVGAVKIFDFVSFGDDEKLGNIFIQSAEVAFGPEWRNVLKRAESGFEQHVFFGDDLERGIVFGNERDLEIARMNIVTGCLELASNGVRSFKKNERKSATANSIYQSGIDRKNATLRVDQAGGELKGMLYEFIESFKNSDKTKGIDFRELFGALTTKSYSGFQNWVMDQYPVTANNIFDKFEQIVAKSREGR